MIEQLVCDLCGAERPSIGGFTSGALHACDSGLFGVLREKQPSPAENFTVIEHEPQLARVVAFGRTYDWRDELKELGFDWDLGAREWWRVCADAEIDEMCEAVERVTHGEVKGRVVW